MISDKVTKAYRKHLFDNARYNICRSIRRREQSVGDQPSEKMGMGGSPLVTTGEPGTIGSRTLRQEV